jgi:CRISPR-associated endonuclease/helicase Cas3
LQILKLQGVFFLATPVSAPRSILDFALQFEALTDNPPYPWQEKLFGLFRSGTIPPNINLPTGSGKTSIIPIWLLALAQQAAENPQGITLPRRLVWVVNRRVVVDQATDEAEEIRKTLADKERRPALEGVCESLRKLSLNREKTDLIAISTLRGEREDNRQWSGDPSRPAIIIGTVDMIGSRLLFSGYGDGKYWRAQHAGLLGQDTLVINDEAHLTSAFATLLSAIEDQQKQTGIKPFRTIRLSATHPSSKCWPDSLEDDRKNKHFRAIFEASKRAQIRDAGKQFSTLLDLASETGPARTLIFVQQPDKVKEISEKLAKRLGQDATGRILTLTGTMRGIERDRMVESSVFKAFAKPEQPSGSYWLIATSAGEVGINISADRLITDLDTLDHLLQRFGRLNRFGESSGEAYVLVSNVEEKDERKKQALAFLRSLDSCGEQIYDISPAALFGRELPPDACSESPLQAELHDWLTDVWSQTSLGSHPARPEVEPWLHGNEKDYAHTYIAWREDVSGLSDDRIDSEERKDVVQKYRVLAHERLQEPTSSLIKKFQTLSERVDPNTRLLCRERDGSVEPLCLCEIADESAFAKIAFRQLILPPGCGSIRNGMFSPEWSPTCQSNDGGSTIEDENPVFYDVSGCKWDEKLRTITANDERASYRAVRNEDNTWTATRLGITVEETVLLNDLELGSLHQFAAGQGWRFLLKVAPECEVDESATALLYFGKARQKTESVTVIFVDRHVADVGAGAKRLAECAGLPQELVIALEKAGDLHDLGKKEPIWQKAAGNLKPNGEFQENEPVAKPIKLMRGRSLGGFRHELASLRYAEKKIEDQNISSELRDLVLHLIAAHHGHARPCFENKAYDRNYIKDSARIALDTPQRFARLQQRYGAWGLAYLESILRAADGIASADSAAEEQPADA